MFRDTSIVVDGINSHPILGASGQAAYVEDRLIGTDIYNHVMASRVEYLQ